MTNIDAHWDYVNNRPKMMTHSLEQKKVASSGRSSNAYQQHRTDRRRFSLLCCFQRQSSRQSRSPVLRFERKSGRDSQTFASPAKRFSMGAASFATRTVEGLTTQQRLQSARSEGSCGEVASPYLSSMLLASKQQHSSRKDSAADSGSIMSGLEVNLEDLWRFGIPVSIRRVLWPFKIGNKLGISKELYQINRKQGLAHKNKVLKIASCDLDSHGRESQAQFSGGSQATQGDMSAMGANNLGSGRVLDLLTLNQIQEDIDKFFEVTESLSIMNKTSGSPGKVTGFLAEELPPQPENVTRSTGSSEREQLCRKKESLLNLILSFLVYRPDVGYVKNMSFIAGTILVYCEEANAFICFANFVH